MAPPPFRQYASTTTLSSRQVTEDTPPDLLEGTMDLSVKLPSGKIVLMTVHRSTPMMDLLIQITTAHRINPGGHVIHLISDNQHAAYKANTPIGTLEMSSIEIVQKSKVIESSKQRREQLQAQHVERNLRLKVNLPRSQLAVYRVPPKTLISDVLQMVCSDKGLDPETHEIRHPVNVDEKLRGSCSLADYHLTEVCIVNKDFRPSPLSVSDLITMASINPEEGKKRKGFFHHIFSRKSKSSTGDSLSSESTGDRSTSPSSSLESSEYHSVSQQLSKSTSAVITVDNDQHAKVENGKVTAAHLVTGGLNRGHKRMAPPPPSVHQTREEELESGNLDTEVKSSISQTSLKSSLAHDPNKELPQSFSTSGSESSTLERRQVAQDSGTVTNLVSTGSGSMGSLNTKLKRKAPAPPKPAPKQEMPTPLSIPEESEAHCLQDSAQPYTDSMVLKDLPCDVSCTSQLEDAVHERPSSPTSSQISSASSLSSVDPSVQTPNPPIEPCDSSELVVSESPPPTSLSESEVQTQTVSLSSEASDTSHENGEKADISTFEKLVNSSETLICDSSESCTQTKTLDDAIIERRRSISSSSGIGDTELESLTEAVNINLESNDGDATRNCVELPVPEESSPDYLSDSGGPGQSKTTEACLTEMVSALERENHGIVSDKVESVDGHEINNCEEMLKPVSSQSVIREVSAPSHISEANIPSTEEPMNIVIRELCLALKDSTVSTQPKLVDVVSKHEYDEPGKRSYNVVLTMTSSSDRAQPELDSLQDRKERSLSSSSFGSCEKDSGNELHSNTDSETSSYESAAPPLPDTLTPCIVTSQGKEIPELRTSPASDTFSQHSKTAEAFKKPRPPVFSISTYKSRSEEESYSSKLVKLEPLNSIDRAICLSDKSNGAESESCSSYYRSRYFQGTSSLNRNHTALSDVQKPKRYPRASSVESRIAYEHRPAVPPKTFNFKDSLLLGKAGHAPVFPVPPLKKAQSVSDFVSGGINNPVPDSGLAQEYYKLQDDFMRWQQQLLQNQQILHSRVAPLAAHPPASMSWGGPDVHPFPHLQERHSFANWAMSNMGSEFPSQPLTSFSTEGRGEPRRKPVEINIPIRIEGRDDPAVENQKNSNSSTSQHVSQPQHPHGTSSSTGVSKTFITSDGSRGWNGNAPARVGVWREQPPYSFPSYNQNILDANSSQYPQHAGPSEMRQSHMMPPGRHPGTPFQHGMQQEHPAARFQHVVFDAPVQCQPEERISITNRPFSAVSSKPVFEMLANKELEAAAEEELEKKAAAARTESKPIKASPPPQSASLSDAQNGLSTSQQVSREPPSNCAREQRQKTPPQVFLTPRPFGHPQSCHMEDAPQADVFWKELQAKRSELNLAPDPPTPGGDSASQIQSTYPSTSQDNSTPYQYPAVKGGSSRDDDSINTRFTSVVTLSNDQLGDGPGQKDRVRSVVQLNTNDPDVRNLKQSGNASPFQSKIISNASRNSRENSPAESVNKASTTPMSAHLVQAVQQPQSSLIRHSPPKDSQHGRLPQGYMTESPVNMSKSEFNESRVLPSHQTSYLAQDPQVIPPPPPPPLNVPPPPPPATELRTSTGKKIVPAKITPELDPRTELMLAIRQFGGSASLRKSGRPPIP